MTASMQHRRVSLRTRRSSGIQFLATTNVWRRTSQSHYCSASAGSPRLIQLPPSSHEQNEGVWIYRGGR